MKTTQTNAKTQSQSQSQNQAQTQLPPAHTLILGGQKSGKSAHAETLAAQWLQAAEPNAQTKAQTEAILLATAQPWDAEMRARIARHKADRAVRAPGLQTLEEPLQLARSIAMHSREQTLLVVDCLTLWLTNWLMPVTLAAHEIDDAQHLQQRRQAWHGERAALLQALAEARGPVVFVSNEIGWGVMPMGRAVRAFADELGSLNQLLAAACPQVVLMAAGLPVKIKDGL